MEEAWTEVPLARTTSRPTILSIARPQAREEKPKPPCVKCPPIPTPGHVPCDVARFPLLYSVVARLPKRTPPPTFAKPLLSTVMAWKDSKSTTIDPFWPPVLNDA